MYFSLQEGAPYIVIICYNLEPHLTRHPSQMLVVIFTTQLSKEAGAPSRATLPSGPLPALSVAFGALVAAPDAPVFWRHPRARFVTVTPSSVTQLCQDHAQRSCREVLHFGYEYLAETWMSFGGCYDTGNFL